MSNEETSTMKKLNITKEQFNRSSYFTKKYGKLEYVSESGKVFKTDKGKVLVFKESTNGYLGIPGTKYSPKRGVVEYQGFTFTVGEIWKLARDFWVEEYGLAPINVKDLEKWLHEDNENMDMMLNLLDDASIEKKYGKDYFKENRKPPRTNKGKVLMFKEYGKRVYPAANGCHINDMGDCFIVTNKDGLNIG